ncbi:MAG: hypothetical protein LC627_06425, partial [Verrucomicrobiaceae bacterium]|nr:hypothetical protein [Verrucomicrobiaceae bacterium]
MNSDEDKIMSSHIDSMCDRRDLSSGLLRWENLPPSTMSHHGGRCCEVARQWILAMDFSQLNGATTLTGPRWLRKKFKWGPSPWPLHWCEAVRRETIDCGALAALAHQLFLGRGVQSYPVQFIMQFSEDAGRQWLASWDRGNGGLHWIHDGLIYHEGCAVVADANELKLWDATASWWVNPKQFGGYGAVLAMRLFDATRTPSPAFSWG